MEHWPIIASSMMVIFLIHYADKGGHQNLFSEKVGHLAQPGDPLHVSWAAKKEEKSLMFILHFWLF